MDKLTQSDNPHYICESIQSILNHHLESTAPLKKVQVTNKIPGFASSVTRQLIRDRDSAFTIARTTDNIEDWRLFKNLRNGPINPSKRTNRNG